MKLSRIPVMALALVALGGSAALAQNPTPQGGPPMGGPGGRGGRGGQMMQQMMFKGITLSADQQKKVDAIVAKYGEQRRAAIEQSQGDREAMRGKMRDMIEAEGKELRAVLTPDQAKVFDRNVAEMRERGRNRGGPPGV